jgi:hypothetical protein
MEREQSGEEMHAEKNRMKGKKIKEEGNNKEEGRV